VLRGLQEGGNALLKKLGGFFQAPSVYMPAPHAPNAQPRSSSSQEHDSEAFFAATFSKFTEALQNADSMTFPVLDEYVVLLLCHIPVFEATFLVLFVWGTTVSTTPVLTPTDRCVRFLPAPV